MKAFLLVLIILKILIFQRNILNYDKGNDMMNAVCFKIF